MQINRRTFMYVIHLRAPIIEGIGNVYPVYKTHIKTESPASACAGAAALKAAASDRK